MIDLFTVFHRGGAVLYTRQLNPVPGNPVDALIQNMLLEERTGTSSYRHDEKYIVKWTLANEVDLVFVAVYLNLTKLLWIDDLLAQAKAKFCHMFRDAIKNVEPSITYTKKFNRVFDELVTSFELGANKGISATEESNTLTPAQPTPSDKKPQHQPSHKKTKTGSGEVESSAESNAESHTKEEASAAATTESTTNSSASEDATPAPAGEVNLAKLAALQQAARSGKPVHQFGKKKKPTTESTPPPSAAPENSKKVKVARTWADNKATKAEAKALDYTRVIDGDNAVQVESAVSGFDNANKPAVDPSKLYSKVEKVTYSDDEDEGDDDGDNDDDESASSSSSKSSGGLFSYFKTLVAGKVLERSDLEPVLQQFKEMLNGKNVAAEISEQLAESVIKTLEGQHLASFTTVKSMVKKAVEDALTRILTPNRQIDILAGIVEANEEKRPYSIVFVGVNGVGKSTSLAKTASYFLSKNLTVGVAACDTFRAGAIEQLRTHTKALGIPLYARGYDRDAASVAQESIAQARRDGLNVCLVDTAGRMQHNEPLMRSLAKLITLNKPDLVLFVGEALVGNDAVDQVKEFNRALADLSDEKKPRLIDGIILTKFDTIDDKSVHHFT